MAENKEKNGILEEKTEEISTLNASDVVVDEVSKGEKVGDDTVDTGGKKGLSMKDYDKKEKRTNFWSIVNLVFFYFLLAVFVGMIVMLLLGFKPAVVLTGSMRPAINPGDVTVYKEVDFKSLEVGDIIMFHGKDAGDESSTDTNITHRIVEMYLEAAVPYVVTHGDANGETATETVYEDMFEGKVMAVVPWIGIPLNAIRNNLFVFIFGALSLILIIYIVSLVIKNKE